MSYRQKMSECFFLCAQNEKTFARTRFVRLKRIYLSVIKMKKELDLLEYKKITMSQVVLNIDSSNSMDYDVFRYGLCDVCYIIDNYYKGIMEILFPTDPVRVAIGMPKKNKLIR